MLHRLLSYWYKVGLSRDYKDKVQQTPFIRNGCFILKADIGNVASSSYLKTRHPSLRAQRVFPVSFQFMESHMVWLADHSRCYG